MLNSRNVPHYGDEQVSNRDLLAEIYKDAQMFQAQKTYEQMAMLQR